MVWSSYGTQLTMLGEDLVAASPKPWLFLDDDWQIHRETQIDVMVRTVERVEALQAPASASHIADQVDNLDSRHSDGIEHDKDESPEY